jgi:serine/threonine protein kinase
MGTLKDAVPRVLEWIGTSEDGTSRCMDDRVYSSVVAASPNMSVSLPRRTYYRAESLGEGSYGSVVTVYDSDGASFAAKLFDSDSGSECDSDSDDCESVEYASCGVDVGALRELSMLRLINGAHPNVMKMLDVTCMEGKLTLIMPKAASNLSDAIEKQRLSTSQKVRVGALLLDALEFLASHSVMHRDIKSDNILLGDDFDPVITDFSLSKRVEPVSAYVAGPKTGARKSKSSRKKAGMVMVRVNEGSVGLHTCGAGTPTYIAPEVVHGNGSYGCKADVWSMGVVFYEMFSGKMLVEVKDKHAFALFEKVCAKLSEKHPVPATMKQMLQVDPGARASAAEALALFLPAGNVELPPRGRLLDIAGLDAAAGAQFACELTPLTPTRACELLGFVSTAAARAAESYWRRSARARALGPAGAAICALIASKIYEVDLHSSDEIFDLHSSLDEYSVADYSDDEKSILDELEFCLAAP